MVGRSDTVTDSHSRDPVDPTSRATANRHLALVLGAIALAFYAGFILSSALK